MATTRPLTEDERKKQAGLTPAPSTAAPTDSPSLPAVAAPPVPAAQPSTRNPGLSEPGASSPLPAVSAPPKQQNIVIPRQIQAEPPRFAVNRQVENKGSFVTTGPDGRPVVNPFAGDLNTQPQAMRSGIENAMPSTLKAGESAVLLPTARPATANPYASKPLTAKELSDFRRTNLADNLENMKPSAAQTAMSNAANARMTGNLGPANLRRKADQAAGVTVANDAALRMEQERSAGLKTSGQAAAHEAARGVAVSSANAAHGEIGKAFQTARGVAIASGNTAQGEIGKAREEGNASRDVAKSAIEQGRVQGESAAREMAKVSAEANKNKAVRTINPVTAANDAITSAGFAREQFDSDTQQAIDRGVGAGNYEDVSAIIAKKGAEAEAKVQDQIKKIEKSAWVETHLGSNNDVPMVAAIDWSTPGLPVVRTMTEDKANEAGLEYRKQNDANRYLGGAVMQSPKPEANNLLTTQWLNEQAQGASPAAPAVAPPVGTERKGFRFKGGNPRDPNAWERI